MLTYSPIKKLAFIACLCFCSNGFAAEALIKISDTLFEVELAITAEERRKGLMNRAHLASNQGMLFVYSEPKIVSFWMHETLIPLDILFFDSEGRLLELFENIPPCKSNPCQTYTNKTPAEFVLELAAGTAKMKSISPGSQFEIIERK